MSKSIGPTALTAALSAAAVLGYLSYRFVGGQTDPSPGAPSSAGNAAPSQGLADSLPPFTLSDLAGNPTPISSWPGKPLVLNFWATWCAPCLREIPLLKELQSTHDSIQVIGIAVDRPDPVQTFSASMDFNYPILIGQNDAMSAAAALGVEVFALPITVFTDAAGAILGIHTGELHAEHLDNAVATLADLGDGRIDRETARARIAGRM
jgi:thiol-disulfide isomerase/thioredoxin